MYSACSFNHVFDVSVGHEPFEHETHGHERSSAHGAEEEEHKHEGISLGAEL